MCGPHFCAVCTAVFVLCAPCVGFRYYNLSMSRLGDLVCIRCLDISVAGLAQKSRCVPASRWCLTREMLWEIPLRSMLCCMLFRCAQPSYLVSLCRRQPLFA